MLGLQQAIVHQELRLHALTTQSTYPEAVIQRGTLPAQGPGSQLSQGCMAHFPVNGPPCCSANQTIPAPLKMGTFFLHLNLSLGSLRGLERGGFYVHTCDNAN